MASEILDIERGLEGVYYARLAFRCAIENRDSNDFNLKTGERINLKQTKMKRKKNLYPFSNQGKIIALEKRFSSLCHHAQIEMRFRT